MILTSIVPLTAPQQARRYRMNDLNATTSDNSRPPRPANKIKLLWKSLLTSTFSGDSNAENQHFVYQGVLGFRFEEDSLECCTALLQRKIGAVPATPAV